MFEELGASPSGCVSLALRQSAVPFLRDRFWVAAAPEALAKSRSERSASCFAAPHLAICQSFPAS